MLITFHEAGAGRGPHTKWFYKMVGPSLSGSRYEVSLPSTKKWSQKCPSRTGNWLSRVIGNKLRFIFLKHNKNEQMCKLRLGLSVNVFTHPNHSSFCSSILSTASFQLFQMVEMKTSCYNYPDVSFIFSSWQQVVCDYQLFIGVCIFQALILDRIEVSLQHENKHKRLACHPRWKELLKWSLAHM